MSLLGRRLKLNEASILIMTKDKTSIDKNKTSEQRKYNYCFEPKHEILLNIINIPAPLSLNFHNIFRITIE